LKSHCEQVRHRAGRVEDWRCSVGVFGRLGANTFAVEWGQRGGGCVGQLPEFKKRAPWTGVDSAFVGDSKQCANALLDACVRCMRGNGCGRLLSQPGVAEDCGLALPDAVGCGLDLGEADKEAYPVAVCFCQLVLYQWAAE
jgi:hypothetical protein